MPFHFISNFNEIRKVDYPVILGFGRIDSLSELQLDRLEGKLSSLIIEISRFVLMLYLVAY